MILSLNISKISLRIDFGNFFPIDTIFLSHSEFFSNFWTVSFSGMTPNTSFKKIALNFLQFSVFGYNFSSERLIRTFLDKPRRDLYFRIFWQFFIYLKKIHFSIIERIWIFLFFLIIVQKLPKNSCRSTSDSLNHLQPQLLDKP